MRKNIPNKPYFSIITCTKNSEKFLRKNIDSVKAQTFKDYEHIFIDGFSNDETRKMIESYKRVNRKSVKVFQKKPLGISDAMNEGIKRARGKYIIHLHSDDYFYDNKVLEDARGFISKHGFPDWIYGKINVVEEDGKDVGVFPKWKIFQISWENLLKLINFIPHQAVFVKKEVFKKFGNFDTSLKTSMDLDLWLRISGKTKWLFFDRIIANYTIGPNSASSSLKAKKENAERAEYVRKKHLSKIEVILAGIINKVSDAINKVYR